jgi:hypothetical protein
MESEQLFRKEWQPAAILRGRPGERAGTAAGAVFRRPGCGDSRTVLWEWLVVQRRSEKVTSKVDRKPEVSVREADVLETMSRCVPSLWQSVGTPPKVSGIAPVGPQAGPCGGSAAAPTHGPDAYPEQES